MRNFGNIKYTFEKVRGKGLYQVRLKGEFVTYVTEKNPSKVDAILKERGYESREDYFEECVNRHFE